MPEPSGLNCTHPAGERIFAPQKPPAAWPVDTPGGRYYAELDLDAPVTREGQLIFFAQFLHTGGRGARLLEGCPLRYHGNRGNRGNHGSGATNVVGTAALSILCGHWRYAHIHPVRGDTLNPPLPGMSHVVSEDVVRRAMKRIGERTGLELRALISRGRGLGSHRSAPAPERLEPRAARRARARDSRHRPRGRKRAPPTRHLRARAARHCRLDELPSAVGGPDRRARHHARRKRLPRRRAGPALPRTRRRRKHLRQTQKPMGAGAGCRAPLRPPFGLPVGRLSRSARFTTQKLAPSRLMANLIALICNWWHLCARLYDGEHHREAICAFF